MDDDTLGAVFPCLCPASTTGNVNYRRKIRVEQPILPLLLPNQDHHELSLQL
jgi:hypothetical protein